MKLLRGFWRSSISAVMLASVLISLVVGCTVQKSTTSLLTPDGLNSYLTNTVETFQPAKEKTGLPSQSVSLPPEATVAPYETLTITAPPASAQPPPVETGMPVEDLVWEMFGKVSLDRAMNDMALLTGEKPLCIKDECYTIKSRQTGSEGLKWAKKYFSEELIKLGYSVELQDWSSSKWADQNLIARKPGILYPEEEIYFFAHIDGAKKGLQEKFPAADDNASGVVDLLELARVLSGYSFQRTVVLLFTTGEEQGTLGVKSFLDQLSWEEIAAIKSAVNIDMVGYDANGDKVMELWHGDHPPSLELATQIMGIIQSYHLELEPILVVGCG